MKSEIYKLISEYFINEIVPCFSDNSDSHIPTDGDIHITKHGNTKMLNSKQTEELSSIGLKVVYFHVKLKGKRNDFSIGHVVLPMDNYKTIKSILTMMCEWFHDEMIDLQVVEGHEGIHYEGDSHMVIQRFPSDNE